MSTTKRPLTAEDLYDFVLAGDPRISPAGDVVAFVRTRIEGEDREQRSQIWIVPTTGGPPRPFTRGPKSDSHPRWSPDGRRLAFVRQTGEGPEAERQIWVMDRDGGEAWQLTTMYHGAGNPLWSPDARYIAFTAARGENDTDEDIRRAKTEDDRKQTAREQKDTARLITRFRYKSDAEGLHPDRRTQVWVLEVPDIPPGSPDQAPRPRQVTAGPFDHQVQDWSPDGRWLAVSASRVDERALIYDIWLFPVSRNAAAEEVPGDPIRLTDGTGIFGEAAWSPKGDQIAVAGHHKEYQSATLTRLWLFPAPGHAGEAVCLTKDWDRGLGGEVNSDLRPGTFGALLTWAPAGSALYFRVSDEGANPLYRMAVNKGEPGEPELIAGGKREIYGFSLDGKGQQAALAISEIFNPGDLFLSQPSSGTERRLTELNKELLDAIQWPELEEIRFPGHDGWTIHGWIMQPVGARPQERYPAILHIHGGPHTCSGWAFHLEIQLQAAWGYAVIFTNPRGSSSYGQEFAQACQGDYGGADYHDLMGAVDHAVSLGYVDDRRVVTTGGSYGGFMTNWIVGRTDRFAAGITHRSISNWLSFWGVSDIGPNFMDGEFHADSLWNGFDELWERSPLKYARNINTPLLICHSENDFRCPMEQAEQFYIALQWQGKDVEFLRHPRSNHELTRSGPPTLRVDRFMHIKRFLDKHVPVQPEAYEGTGG